MLVFKYNKFVTEYSNKPFLSGQKCILKHNTKIDFYACVGFFLCYYI